MPLSGLLLTDTSTACLICVFTVLALYFFFSKKTQNSEYSFPPGPTPLPVLGNINIFNMWFPHLTLHKLSEKYGGVFTFHVGSTKFVILCGYDAVKEALVNQPDDFGDRGLRKINKELSRGDGIVFGRGESWKTMRRFTLSTLRDFGMGKRTIEDRIVEECQNLMDVFESHKGQPFNPKMIINSAVSNIICSIIFGDRFDYQDSHFLHLQTIMNESFKLSVSPQIQLYNVFPFLGFLFSDYKKATQINKEFRKFIFSVFEDRKYKVDKNDLRSFIDSFISRQQEEEVKNTKSHFHEGNLIASSLNLFAAGTETTSTTLRWGLLLMMKHPEVQAKVHQEIENVIGKDRCPQTEDRKSMPYTDAVIHEIQRFSNVAPMSLLHQTATDTTFRGYRIPKGTPVIPLLTSVLFDKTQWATPYKFNPAHFLDDQGKFIRRDAFLPFSAGRRVCLGETLAKMELFLFFTMLLQKFVFRPPAGVTPEQLDLSPVPGLTLTPKDFKMCAVSH
ncbi:cytochrome P450 2K1-like [Polypterus senegalus]|uniref:cytochrome P450 2K1-like n=1 Tax=Polypterus senegalus TaxID=55291 RepID=UPI0019635158|nr:cytochrome P450 2K1-like [Polypterus senegalus]